MASEKVAVAISGGVDSAVAAALLKERGYEVIGVHLRFCEDNPRCGGEVAERSATAVAKHLAIPFVVWDMRRVFKQKVIDCFFDEYRRGRTPVPCVICNREIKFGVFLKKALKELGVDKVATGHYARLRRTRKHAGTLAETHRYRYHLFRGVDEKKDQSYFLWTLTQEKLQHILLPVGEMTKEEVRAKAQEFGLPCATRPESQSICFLGSSSLGDFLRDKLPIHRGPVANTKGEVIGEHNGVWFYTEGQRHGFQVTKPSYPLYVIRKDVGTNTLVVGRGKESEVKEFEVRGVNWVSPDYKQPTTNSQLSCGVRIRHLGEIMPATIESDDSRPCPSKADQPLVEVGGSLPEACFAAGGESLAITLATPTRGVAPGQSAVFYGSTSPIAGGLTHSTGAQGCLRRNQEATSSPQVRYEEVLGGGTIV